MPTKATFYIHIYVYAQQYMLNIIFSFNFNKKFCAILDLSLILDTLHT